MKYLKEKKIKVKINKKSSDDEYIKIDKDNLGKHMNEIKSLPKYFLKMKKIEEGLYEKRSKNI